MLRPSAASRSTHSGSGRSSRSTFGGLAVLVGTHVVSHTAEPAAKRPSRQHQWPLAHRLESSPRGADGHPSGGRAYSVLSQVSDSVYPAGKGSLGSYPTWQSSVIHACPVTLGTTAWYGPTLVSSSTLLRKRLPMTDSCTNVSPTAICPRACMTASRALVPVPHGDRSSRPGETTTAFRDVRVPSSRRSGPANSVMVTPGNDGFSGWIAVSCSAAARLISWPCTHRSRPSSGVSENPRAGALTIA